MKRILAGLAGLGLALTTLFALQAPAGAAQAGAEGTPMAATVIGILYQHANMQGATLTVTGVTCTTTTADVDNALPSLPAGWNDAISSFRSYANCWTKLYEHANFGGSTFGYAESGNVPLGFTVGSITWS